MLTRHGAPHFLRDLEGVSAGQAKTIIILQPDTAKVGTGPPAADADLLTVQLNHGGRGQHATCNSAPLHLSGVWLLCSFSGTCTCHFHATRLSGSARAVHSHLPNLRLQEPFKNTAATVMALRTTRSHWHPSLQASGQTVVIQTAPDARPVPRTALSGALTIDLQATSLLLHGCHAARVS